MDCAQVSEQLVDFHFASCPQSRREAVRAHLRRCSACVQEYLDLKLDLDSAEVMAEAPSAALHARLRQDVAALAAASPRAPSWIGRRLNALTFWLHQPSPRYLATAAWGVLLLVGVGLYAVPTLRPARAPHEGPMLPVSTSLPEDDPGYTLIRASGRRQGGAPPTGCSVDTARQQAVSITYY